MNPIRPQLCEIKTEPFNDPKYIFEIKYDGIRAISQVDKSGYKLWARSGTDKTSLFPDLDLKTRLPAILDGEIVCIKDGKFQFNAIQHRTNRLSGIEQAVRDYPATYMIFDVLELTEPDGTVKNLRGMPLLQRKLLLEAVLVTSPNVQLAPQFTDGIKLFADMRAMGMEGIVGKHIEGTYQEGKRGWYKIKVPQTGQFVVVGHTQGTGWRASTFGALVLADMDMKYVGSVGTGFDNAEIDRIYARLKATEAAGYPFARDEHIGELALWIKPEIIVKVNYLEKTNDGRLRFPSYKGMVN